MYKIGVLMAERSTPRTLDLEVPGSPVVLFPL